MIAEALGVGVLGWWLCRWWRERRAALADPQYARKRAEAAMQRLIAWELDYRDAPPPPRLQREWREWRDKANAEQR